MLLMAQPQATCSYALAQPQPAASRSHLHRLSCQNWHWPSKAWDVPRAGATNSWTPRRVKTLLHLSAVTHLIV
jgi:hypothetical protein